MQQISAARSQGIVLNYCLSPAALPRLLLPLLLRCWVLATCRPAHGREVGHMGVLLYSKVSAPRRLPRFAAAIGVVNVMSSLSRQKQLQGLERAV